MLRVDDLTVSYGDLTILNGVSFTLEPGEWLMIVGPNGAGKSTLINAVTGGVPSKGSVLFEGKDIRSMKPHELARGIGVCVSIGGTIGFVGLVTPHMVRLLVGPNHKRLLPSALFGGGVFLMLSDLIARTLLNPVELPIGVVTSIIGAVAFVYIYGSSRKGR